MRLHVLPALATCALFMALASPAQSAADYAIKLQTGDIVPQAQTDVAAATSNLSGKHVLVQFDHPITLDDKDRLASQGITILDYIPSNTWIARIDHSLSSGEVAQMNLKWVGAISTDQKISPLLTEFGIRETSKRDNGRAQFAIIFQKDQDLTAWSERLKSDFNAEIIGTEPSVNKIDLILPEATYLELAKLDEVQWVEQGPPEKLEYNNSARDNVGATVVQAAPYSLDGSGIMVALWDGGRAKSTHPDFSGRVLDIDASAVAAHATHVAGTIVGDGTNSGGVYRGMAPAAQLMTQQWWNSASEAATEYQQATTFYQARTANNSWGYGVGDPATNSACASTLGNYFSEDATLDNIVRGDIGNPISIVYSAGNQRGSSTQYCGSIGWTYNTVDPLASSKNVISVGAINSNNSTMTSFSSWGPTDDGRIKPDVVGPGCQTNDDHGLTSCATNNGYTVMCGTSMSGPVITGVVALLYQQQHISFTSSSILPSTIRGILINTAIDLGAVGPDYQYGWGKVDAVTAVKKISAGTPSYVESQITQATTQSYDLTIPGGTSKLKVTLAWDDIGGTAISGAALINDLDLVLIDPFGAEKQVWTLDGTQPSNAAVVGTDHINNVETVEITNPVAGLWKARVSGFAVPSGPQKYSLILTPDSINTPGQNRAWAVFDTGDQTKLPGASTQLDYWVSNTGGAADSAHVVISDNLGWLTATKDTTVALAAHDSAHVFVTATVPANALAGQQSITTCRATSKSDTTIYGQNTTAVTAGATYALTIDRPNDDSTQSPSNYPFNVKLHNNGNAPGVISLAPGSVAGWTITPGSRVSTVPARDSVTYSFTLTVPAEVADLTVDTIRLFANSSGQATDTNHFNVKIKNPVFPPALVAPAALVYSQSRTFAFSWSGAADSYRLMIATDSSFTSVVRSYPGLTALDFTMPLADSLPDNRYYWGVKKYIGTDSSSLQLAAHQIFVDTKKPGAVTPDLPLSGAILTNKVVPFSFSTPTPPGATEAPEVTNLQLAHDSLFTVGLQTYPQIVGNTFQTPDTLAEGRWYWRLQRVDLAGNQADYSSIPTFLVDSKTPNVPTQTFPADNATLGTNPLVLKWTTGAPPSYEVSREYYYVHISKLANFTDYSFTGYIYADSLSLTTPFLVQGQRYYWRVKATDSAGFYTNYSAGANFLYRTYICGDVNNSGGAPDLGDLSALVAYLTSGTPIPPVLQAASVNCNGPVDLADLSVLVAYLTGTGVTLCCP